MTKWGERLGPAMKITGQDEADAYFEKIVLAGVGQRDRRAEEGGGKTARTRQGRP